MMKLKITIAFVLVVLTVFLCPSSAAEADTADELEQAEIDAEQDHKDTRDEDRQSDNDYTEDMNENDEEQEKESTPKDTENENAELGESSSVDNEDIEELEAPTKNDARPFWGRRRRRWSIRRRRRRWSIRRRRRRWSIRRRRRRWFRRRRWLGRRRRRIFRFFRRIFSSCRRSNYSPGRSIPAYTNSHQCKSFTKIDDLARCWAPRIYLAKGEEYKPSSVDFFLPRVYMVSSNGHTTIKRHLTASNLPKGHASYFLKSKAKISSPSSVISLFYGQPPSQAPIYTLYREFVKNGEKITDLIYWAFFPYNRGKNVCIGLAKLGKCFGGCTVVGNHVGDWEHVTVRLANHKPRAMYIGAHNFGGVYNWNDAQKTFIKGRSDRVKFTSTGHPIVFSALGSHGMWTTNKRHTYKTLKIIGDKLQDLTSTGTAWDTWKNIKVIQYKRNGGYTGADSWLNYRGRWGDKERGCGILKAASKECRLNSGPTSPNFKGVMTSTTLNK